MLGSLPKQQNLRPGFTGFKNPANPGYLGSETQLTQVAWVQKPSLPSSAWFIKTSKAKVLARFARFVDKVTKPRELASLGS